ncbi:Tab2/Atab2 family RNA-binding protein [Leptolyngbya sp. FACHB-17]|uniref:Tab2/Atab2 family RNA-binding protein n=1 Tax=unclassified Leptolyngbya TaxID=2650499 RepID=UPI0016801C71|nr:Tab2/Atab2 family RNA-binding protein [Leptolyngbya sp. FACHB-17]MBD2083265.1 Tab2/Atab2 family RNA-binding protein [Leptolyngbya sp. FACHB-17]
MATIWELDYYSRPILDEQNKKVWEVLICESPTAVDVEPEKLFQFSKYCPSTEVNSGWLKDAIEAAIANAPNPPDKIRFFRQAMSNMITTACKGLDVPAVLSRRTFALTAWMQDRAQNVYPKDPGYQPSINPSVVFPVLPPQVLPDALQGQKWTFATLPLEAFADMGEWSIDFGEAFPLSLTQLEPDTPVPGLIIFTKRATAMAAWMSGLEIAAVKYDPALPNRLLLETGVNDRWFLTTLDQRAVPEAQQFEAAKERSNQVHFLAIQESPDVEAFAGFWLMQEIGF